MEKIFGLPVADTDVRSPGRLLIFSRSAVADRLNRRKLRKGISLAHFQIWPPRSTPAFKPQGFATPSHAAAFPGPALILQPGQNELVALWGGGPGGERLVVMALDTTIAGVAEQRGSWPPNTRVFRISAKRAGVAAIQARMPDRTPGSGGAPTTSSGASWANMAVQTLATPLADANEEPLLDMGVNAPCKKAYDYVDNVISGQLDLATRKFSVVHADGTVIPVDLGRVLSESKRVHSVYVYYRNKGIQKVFPRVWHKDTAPNIVFMSRDIEQTFGSAQAMNSLGIVLLEVVPVSRPPAFRGFAKSAGKVKVPYKSTGQMVLNEAKLKELAIKSWMTDGRNSLVKVVSKARGPQAQATGYITQHKFVSGRDPRQIEKILGLRANELGEGCYVSRLNRLPSPSEFELRSYTHLPDGKPFAGGEWPPGLGAPQWQLTSPIEATPLKFVGPGEVL